MPPVPTVKVSSRGAKRLKDGHVWVYRSDIVADGNAAPGSLVRVLDDRGKTLGSALYSSSSQIAIRLISPDEVKDLSELLHKRIQAAIAYRGRFVQNTDRSEERRVGKECRCRWWG